MNNDVKKTLWIWEQSEISSSDNVNEPTSSVSVLQLEELDIDKFCFGKSCGALLSKDGTCYQVGEPGKSDLSLSGIQTTIFEISALKDLKVKEVSCGYHHIALITESGAAFCWGASDYGQCGVIADLVSEPRIISVNGSTKDVKFLSVACGKSHTMAISTSYELWGWGASQMIGGVSATRPSSPCPDPEIVQHLCGRRVFQVSCGKFHTAALAEKIQKIPQSSTVCPICKQDIYKMYDTDDQVIITDTHVCTCAQTSNEEVTGPPAQQKVITKSKFQTHNRSASLPFFERNVSPLLARREHLSQTPPSLSPLSDLIRNSGSTKSLPGARAEYSLPEADKLEMMSLPKSIQSESITSGSNNGHVKILPNEKNSVKHLENDKLKTNSSLSKSYSTPADLCKEVGRTGGSVTHFQCKLVADEETDSAYSPLERSHSPSQTSLDECKARMTLPVSSELPVDMDPKSAIKYLEQISPDVAVGKETIVQKPLLPTDEPLERDVGEQTEEPEPVHHADGTPKSLSEKITHTLTEIQLLSPLNAYSKNVFTGVVDGIGWIKTSAYDKGVAPIRDFLSKDKMPNIHRQDSDNISHDDPLRSITPPSYVDENVSGEKRLTLHTEVWTWGKNNYGQLGFSDTLDRYQPICIKSLSNRGIVKLSCGANHSIALTSNSEVFSWGSNKHNQLGRSNLNTSTPAKMESKSRIWDVAAGKHHTLILADTSSQEPAILFCGVNHGSQTSHPLKSNGQQDQNGWKLRTFEFSHDMGLHSKVISGASFLSSSISEKNPSSSAIALHNFAKSEREFYQQITLIKTKILRPLKFSDLWKKLEGSTYGEILLQTLDRFGQMSYNIGLNTVQLTQSVVRGVEAEQETFKYFSSELFQSYKIYFKSLNDIIAYGLFEKCQDLSTKQCKFLSKPGIIQVFKILLGEKRMSKLPSENFLQLLQLPAFRLREYTSSLNRLATALEENVTLSSLLEKLSAQSEGLWNDINTLLQSANKTRGFWKNEFKSTKLGKVAESLKKVGRYLILQSKTVHLDIAHSGRFSSNWFVLFTDCLVLMRNAVPAIHPLYTVWCSPVTDSDEKSHQITITTPEEEILAEAPTEDTKTKWVTSLNRAINNLITPNENDDMVNKENKHFHRSPPLLRHAKHIFTKDSDLKGATYNGAWLNGKPHGKGQLTWNDGRTYKGNFRNGKEDGYGEWKAAADNLSTLKYHGWWKDGKMDGYGKLWYSKYQAYEGEFVSGMREGHGTLRTGSVTEGSVHVGTWKNNQKNGFGSEDNITKGEKYLGMWVNDEKHGVGILVTLDGLYVQSCFSHGHVSGDTLIIEGKYVFEGHVSSGLALSGKGRLTLPTGDKLEGSFSGSWSDNIRISGNFVRLDYTLSSNRPESPKSPVEPSTSFTNITQKDCARSILRRYNRHVMKKLTPGKSGKSFPLTLHPDVKWTEVFTKCRSLLKCPEKDDEEKPVDIPKIWDAVSVAMTNAKRMRDELKLAGSSPRKKVEQQKLDWLERVPSVVLMDHASGEDVKLIKEYLVQAFGTTLHPLGELAESLGNVFRDSYSGAGAHKWLLTQAVADVRSFVRRAYDILRLMFPLLGKEHNASHMKIQHNHADGEHAHGYVDETITAGDLLLPVLLPRVYPTLFTLYALRHEAEDKSYWERVSRLNRHPDIALLSFLGVKPKFWLLDEKEIPPLETSPEDGQLYGSIEQVESSKWRHLLVARAKDCSFLSAIETLQLISTTFIPAEKLNVIQNTFKEINSTVLAHHKQGYTWSMDDLFPVFQYVVIRARIGHLGCEIQLIEDFLEPDLCKGEKGIMFTTLKACYFQIRMEKNL